MAAATGLGGGGPSISRKLRRRSRAIYAVLAAALAVCIASASVLLLGYRPDAARYSAALSGLRAAASAVQDERSILFAGLAAPGAGSAQQAAAARSVLDRADAAILASGATGRRVLDDLIKVNSTEQAWNGWTARALQQLSTGVPDPKLIEQGDSPYRAYRAASSRAIADLSGQYADALANERTVILYWLIVDGSLVILAGVLVAWTRRRVARTTSAAVGSLLQSVRQIEAGEVIDLRALEAPAELEELSRVVAGLALELDSVRGAVGVSSSRGEDRARRLAQVLDLTQTISGHLNLPAVLSSVSRAALEVSGAERAVVWIAEEDGLRAGATASRGTQEPVAAGALASGSGSGGFQSESTTGFAPEQQPSEPVAQAAAYGRTIRYTDGRHQQLAVPMTSGGRVLGVIDLRGREVGGMPEDDVSLVETVASHGASAIAVAREHGVTESMSITDPLTHLPNRRQLDHDLATECERARRYRRSSALVMMDVDGFKAFNDRHGHLAADQILAEFGRLLAESIRGSDSAYRYGGDEFVVLVREASVAAAADLAERLRHLVAERFSVLPPDAPVTASFGVVGVDQVDPDPSTLLRAADEALYSAKERGRNRVVAFR
ncbi:MAG TPA: sensor domain-containing diguanylate cyclase [Acidimicrobiales bacterium]|nr:sensor domain-containing diguanylate cyclase [Acidimicrobiales bacterium]